MMKMLPRSIAGIALLSASIFAALAEEPADDTDEDAETRLSEMLCERYGPGYELVPGTMTCINVNGYISVDVYSRSHRSKDKDR